MTPLEFLAITAAGVLYGWLWADPSARLLAPIEWAVDRVLYKESEGPGIRFARKGPIWTWFRYRRNCPVCMGFDASLLATWHFTREASWDLLAWPVAAAGIHLIWQHTLGVAHDLVDALTRQEA